MIDLVIPYIKSDWGEELKFALRSWEINFKEQFRLTIYGELPGWLCNANFVNHNPINRRQLHDIGVLNKMRRLYWMKRERRSFLWSNDDMYLIKPICLNDINKPFYHDKPRKDLSKAIITPWVKRLINTINRCRELGFNDLNAETHLPIYYNIDILKKTFKNFSCITNQMGGWSTKTAYIATYLSIYPDVDKYQCDQIKSGVYNQYTKLKINDNTLILNHNDDGLTKEVKQFLQDTFTKPSRFEK